MDMFKNKYYWLKPYVSNNIKDMDMVGALMDNMGLDVPFSDDLPWLK